MVILAAMVGSVIYNVLHGLPERIAVDAEFQRLCIPERGRDRSCFSPRTKVSSRVSHAPPSARLQRLATSANCVVSGSEDGERPWKPLQPNPFGSVNVPQGIAHGRKTRAQGLRELFCGQRGSGVQRARGDWPRRCSRTASEFRPESWRTNWWTCASLSFAANGSARDVDRRLFAILRGLSGVVRLGVGRKLRRRARPGNIDGRRWR